MVVLTIRLLVDFVHPKSLSAPPPKPRRRRRRRAPVVSLVASVLFVADLVAGLSRGFGGGGGTPKPKSPKRKKKTKTPSSDNAAAVAPALRRTDSAALDKWGLPADFDERAEAEPVARIASRCARAPDAARGKRLSDASIFDASDGIKLPNNVMFRRDRCDPLWLPRLRLVHLDPLVLAVDDLLAPHECDALISLASGSSSSPLVSSMPSSSTRAVEMPRDFGTFDASQAARRTSTTWYARFKEPEVAPLLARAARLFCGVSRGETDRQDDVSLWTKFEEIQIARYLPGQQFKWHEDAVPPALVKRGDGGQRVATLLVYLSGDGRDEHGGRTTFRDLGPLAVAPRKGSALLFFPAIRQFRGETTAEDSTPYHWLPDDRTVHAAEPVLERPDAPPGRPPSTKWVSQLWLHEAPYPPTIFKDDNERDDALARLVLRGPFGNPPPPSTSASR